MLVNPDLRNTWEAIIHATEIMERNSNNPTYITRFGLAGFSGVLATFMCTVAVVFSLYMILQNYKKIQFFFIMVVNVLGNIFYGRTGLICSFICIFIFFVYYILVKKNVKLFLLCVFSGLTIFIVLSYLYNTNQVVAIWLDWAFIPYRNWINTGKFGNNSSNVLIHDMYFLPEYTTLLFGDGKYTSADGFYYMDTDSGFMRLMLYSGVFVQSIVYISLLALLISSTYSLIKTSKSGYSLMFFLLGFIFIFFEFKGEKFNDILAVILPIAFYNKEMLKRKDT
jgi:hypothetical protein